MEELAAALVVLDLSKTFRSGFLRRPIRGIEGVSFSVAPGEVFALLGHNGAGKTTTINCILDLVKPDRGEVTLLGQSNRKRDSRRRVGYLPERPYFFEHLSGRELLEFYARLLDLPVRQVAGRIDRILAQVGLTHVAGRRLRKYSKGMLQRIGLAQALLGDPDLLILDEPMSGLDPLGRRQVRELLLDLKNRGKTIILSSHIVPDVELLADSVGILREGRLVLTKHLDDVTGDCSYQVKLGRKAGPAQAASPTTTVEVPGVDKLREVLADCHRDAVPVLAVETRRSGLEELFLQAHTARGGGTA